LLRGGYGLGYVTHNIPRDVTLVTILDVLLTVPTPSAKDLLADPLIVDMMSGVDFIGPKNHPNLAWVLTSLKMPLPVQLTKRFVKIGLPPKRKDLLGILPDTPLSSEEAERLPTLGTTFPPGNTAQIEVALRRLDTSWVLYARAWASEQAAGTTPPAPPHATARKIRVSLATRGSFPTNTELKKRDRVERAIRERRIGIVGDVGAGLGSMDITVESAGGSSDLVQDLQRLLVELRIRGTVTAE
jgi:hypothetical protein